ncbi:MAG TPA: archaellin/type IV pilin N-terminal domain-containing protein [Candidatus Nanoarchaeia archaeon]|nr:archaellin/type IV pilin N-terminal domain-containing protein [Candidatus Nanoarchaeia archaeon]
MFKNKKGVSEVITAVLMIVLVIAAIAILATVVITFVRDNAQGLPDEANCLTNSFSLDIESATINQSVASRVLTSRIKRTSGDVNITALAFFVDGQKTTFSPLNSPTIGETIAYTATLTNADVVNKNLEISAVLGSKTCPISDVAVITNKTI